MMDVRAIRTEADYDWALVQIEPYFDNDDELAPEDADRFEVLSTLIQAYQAKRWPIEPSHPVELIAFAMEQGGHTQGDLAQVLGSKSRASEVLNRKRRLTLEMIVKLEEAWHIPAGALARPYEVIGVAIPTPSRMQPPKPIAAKLKRAQARKEPGKNAQAARRPVRRDRQIG